MANTFVAIESIHWEKGENLVANLKLYYYKKKGNGINTKLFVKKKKYIWCAPPYNVIHFFCNFLIKADLVQIRLNTLEKCAIPFFHLTKYFITIKTFKRERRPIEKKTHAIAHPHIHGHEHVYILTYVNKTAFNIICTHLFSLDKTKHVAYK